MAWRSTRSGALLSDAQAVAKRFVRARPALRDAEVELVFPPKDEVVTRLGGVMKVLYLLFNEGYSSLRGPRHIREELCAEAIRLGEILARHPSTGTPPVHALVALMLLHSSCFTARMDDARALLTIEKQDRGAWDRGIVPFADDDPHVEPLHDRRELREGRGVGLIDVSHRAFRSGSRAVAPHTG